MSQDDDDTSHFNNEPQDQEEEEEQVHAEVQEPKRKRPRGKSSSFSPDTDPICVAIEAFLNQSPLPHFTHRTTFEHNGQQVSVGNMMYTLRRQSRKEDQSTIVAARLKHLSQNENWTQFMKNEGGAATLCDQTTNRESKTESSNDSKSPGIEKLTQCCLGKMYQLSKMKTEDDELRWYLWQSFPELRQTMQDQLCATLVKNKLTAHVE